MPESVLNEFALQLVAVITSILQEPRPDAEDVAQKLADVMLLHPAYVELEDSTKVIKRATQIIAEKSETIEELLSWKIKKLESEVQAQRPIHVEIVTAQQTLFELQKKVEDAKPRIEARLPRFLHRYTTPLRNAPVSHISAFLILHELTAIVPLFGLAALFHYTNYLPPLISEGKWVAEGTEKFGRYLRRKGWISQADEDKVEGRSGKWFGRGEGGVRIVVELATAYAITKALLPVRLVLSVWGTPWFARWSVLPVSNLMKRMWQRKGGVTKGKASPAAGTGAVGASVLPIEAKVK
ncbi:hypothetical protein LTS10_004544 [Elasticomyces elasticus]|nr:hypothetical protein LTS10_004544 [Elasticomyces elasticus]